MLESLVIDYSIIETFIYSSFIRLLYISPLIGVTYLRIDMLKEYIEISYLVSEKKRKIKNQ